MNKWLFGAGAGGGDLGTELVPAAQKASPE